MAHILDFALTKLKEAFCWCISKTKKFFDRFFKETENSTNNAEKFSDNFSREFKESLLKSKTVINTVIKRVTSTTSTPMSSFFCSVRKLNLGLLETSVSSVGEKLKNLLAFRKKFMNLTSEAANKIGRRFSIDICYDDEKLQALTGLVVEIVGLVRSVKLKEAFRRCISKTKFFQNLLEDTENSMNQAKKFSDNFSQKFSEPLLKSKPMIDTIIEQVTSTTSTLMSSFFCSARKLNPSLENFASSLVEKLQNLSVCGKEIHERSCKQNWTSVWYRCMSRRQKTAGIDWSGFRDCWLCDKCKEEGAMGNSDADQKKKKLWGIRNTFFRICWPGIEEFAKENIDSFLKTYFKRLAEDEKTRG